MTMMTPILAVVLALATPAAVAGEHPAAGTPDLVIVGSSFGRVVQRTLVDASGPIPTDRWGRPRPRMRGLPPPKVLLKREAYVLVRNVGTRNVETVEWSFSFYSDAKHENFVGRHTFRSKESIRPGEMKFLSVTVKDAAPTAYDSVSIERIGFDDGASTGP